MARQLEILFCVLVRVATSRSMASSISRSPLLESEERTFSSQSEPLQLRGVIHPPNYRRYHTEMLVNESIPCTDDEKLCFEYNLIYHPKAGICRPVGEAHDYRCDVRANRRTFFSSFGGNGYSNGGGISGICFQDDLPCSDGYHMVHDDLCHSKSEVRDVICGCESEPAIHFLGGMECRCSPATVIHVEQPQDKGRCRIPDLRFPDVERTAFFHNPYDSIQGFISDYRSLKFDLRPLNMTCSEETALCFSKEKLRVSNVDGCFTLGERGPCLWDYTVALDSQAARSGQVQGRCVHSRGDCPLGQKRMAFDGQCHHDRIMTLTAPGRVIQNQFGAWVLVPHGFGVYFHPTKGDANVCILKITAVG